MPRPSRREFLAAAGAATAALALPRALAAPRKPNVVLLLADDLGYGQVGCYPQTRKWRTPQIDRIAAAGVRFTDGYSAGPMCLPSRASLLTGRYYQRFHIRKIPATERMIPQHLAPAGYVSACIGKWHNTMSIGVWKRSDEYRTHPLEWGFDEFFGFLGGMRRYFDPKLGYQTGRGWIPMPLYDGTEPVSKIQYLTDELTDRGIAFIRRHRAEPFFLYLSYNAIHTPVEAPEALVAKHGGDKVAAMLDSLDQGVGRVLDTLEELGLRENTLVLFIGDNGGYLKDGNWTLHGRKGSLFEGGLRVPFLASWPARLPKATVYAEPVTHRDVLPTIVAAAGLPIPKELDGANLLPCLLGERKKPPHETLFWGGRGRFAVRRGPWKLVNDSDARKGEPTLRLYNLANDLAEQHNVLGEHKAIADELAALHKQWLADVGQRGRQ